MIHFHANATNSSKLIARLLRPLKFTPILHKQAANASQYESTRCNNYNPRIMKAQYPLSFQSNSYVAQIKPEENTRSVCSDIKVYQNHKLY